MLVVSVPFVGGFAVVKVVVIGQVVTYAIEIVWVLILVMVVVVLIVASSECCGNYNLSCGNWYG